MTDLMQILYPLPDARQTPVSLLRWWEARRLFYNKVVGATGLVTLTGTPLRGGLKAIALAEPPSFAASTATGTAKRGRWPTPSTP